MRPATRSNSRTSSAADKAARAVARPARWTLIVVWVVLVLVRFVIDLLATALIRAVGELEPAPSGRTHELKPVGRTSSQRRADEERLAA